MLHLPRLLLLLPSIALLYALAVCAFLYGWGESPLLDLVSRPICQVSLVWWSLAVAFCSNYNCTYSYPINEENNNATAMHHPYASKSSSLPFFDYRHWAWAGSEGVGWILLAVFHSLVSLWILRTIRVELVEGGPPPAESVLTTQLKQCKVLVITGCNQGIGKETLRLLFPTTGSSRTKTTTTTSCGSDVSHTVVMCCRNSHKARQAAHDIHIVNRPNILLEIIEVDLSNLDQVRTAAAAILKKFPVVHILINNAGIMMKHHELLPPYGLETTMAANHLGHFLLTRLLRPVDCIINVTSCTYALADPDFASDLFCTTRGGEDDGHDHRHGRSYSMFGQYAASKACQLLFTAELANINNKQQRRKSSFNKVSFHAVHPGMVRTNVVRHMHGFIRLLNQMFGALVYCFQKSPSQGAWCTVHAVNEAYKHVLHNKHEHDDHANTAIPSSSSLSCRSWVYWVNRRPGYLMPWILDDAKARHLWQISSALVTLPADDNDDDVPTTET